MLKALRLDNVQARQVFLLASPSGHDVKQFFPLSDLFSGMEASTAETLVAAWRDSTTQSARSATSRIWRKRRAPSAAVRRQRPTDAADGNTDEAKRG